MKYTTALVSAALCTLTWALPPSTAQATEMKAQQPPEPASAAAGRPGAGGTPAERGAYLVSVGGCVECHTAEGGEPYAGGQLMPTPFGKLSTPNITPDIQTGIGGITDAQFYRVFHDGIGRKGEYLYPAMPFPWYTNVSREDVAAIKAYLFTLKPVHKPRVDSSLVFPFNVRTALLAWRTAFFKPATPIDKFVPANELHRGDYLVNGLGHCGECHNGVLLAGASKVAKPLQGGAIDNWYAPNITSSVHDGIGGWSDAELTTFLKTGAVVGKGIAVGKMAETAHGLSKLTEQDVHSIALYLKSTTPVNSKATLAAGNAGSEAHGAQVYASNCASCHGVDGRGQAGVIPALAGNGAVTAKGPQNIVSVVLGGLEARKTYAPMLAIGAGMSDQDIADAVNHVRRSWGNKAPANATADMVDGLRAKVNTSMNGRLGCPAVEPASLARTVGGQDVAGRIAETNAGNMAEQVQALVSSVKKAGLKVPQADVVNGLTSAYCSKLHSDPALAQDAKALQLGQFATLVYTQLTAKNALK